MSRMKYGQVAIELPEEELLLKPTLGAYTKIDARFGGIRNALDSVTSMNIATLAFIVSCGAGIPQRDAGELPEKLFAAGTVNVMPKVTEYLTHLLNPTGKSLEEQRDAAQGDDEPGE